MSTALFVAAAEGSEAVNELPFPPVAFGIIAFAALMSLLAITFAFKSVGSRH